MTIANRKEVPVMEGLWKETDKGNFLVGSQCEACEEVFFPKKELNFCNHCHKEFLKAVTFNGTGHLVAFTKVEREPAGGFYKGKVPYLYGIIQLDEGVRIYSQLVEDPQLEIGAKVDMVIEKLYEEEDHDVLIYKFQPKNSQKG